jgi:hypothetical protein
LILCSVSSQLDKASLRGGLTMVTRTFAGSKVDVSPYCELTEKLLCWLQKKKEAAAAAVGDGVPPPPPPLPDLAGFSVPESLEAKISAFPGADRLERLAAYLGSCNAHLLPAELCWLASFVHYLDINSLYAASGKTRLMHFPAAAFFSLLLLCRSMPAAPTARRPPPYSDNNEVPVDLEVAVSAVFLEHGRRSPPPPYWTRSPSLLTLQLGSYGRQAVVVVDDDVEGGCDRRAAVAALGQDVWEEEEEEEEDWWFPRWCCPCLGSRRRGLLRDLLLFCCTLSVQLLLVLLAVLPFVLWFAL